MYSLLPHVATICLLNHPSLATIDWVGLVADSLGHLVGVVSVLGLQRLDERDVLGLGLLLGDALVDLPLPGVLLCLAL